MGTFIHKLTSSEPLPTVEVVIDLEQFCDFHLSLSFLHLLQLSDCSHFIH